MAIRKVIDLNADTTVTFDKPGQKLQGYYIGFKTVTTSFGPSKLHIFQGENGTVGAWGCSNLDAKLTPSAHGHPGFKLGMMAYITYTTASKLLKGRRTPKVFDVEFDDEDIIDVSNVAVSLSQEPADDSETPDTGYEQETPDSDPYEPEAEEEQEEAPPVQTAPPRKGAPVPLSQATKTKAQEILARARANSAAKQPA